MPRALLAQPQRKHERMLACGSSRYVEARNALRTRSNRAS